MHGEQFGPYRLDKLLGRGGMGEVYRAFDIRKRNRVVALKVLPPQLSADEGFRERFEREARITGLLREPHIVPVHDYGEIDGRLYIDMRLIEGVDLGRLIADAGRLAPTRAIAIIEQVASALDAAHSQRLVHRDIKPSNVLVATVEPEFAYLVDFGIAQSLDSTSIRRLTTPGQWIGTIGYMAPERFSGMDADARVDTFSLACVLYACVTGSQPYRVETHPAFQAGRLTLPPRARDHQPDLPVDLDDVIARGMAADPDERYASAVALADAAVRAVSGKGTKRKREQLDRDSHGVVRVRAGSAENATPGHIGAGSDAIALHSGPSGTSAKRGRNSIARLQRYFRYQAPIRTHRWGIPAFLAAQATFWVAAILAVAAFGQDSQSAQQFLAVLVIPGMLSAGVAILIVKLRGAGPANDLQLSWRRSDFRSGVTIGTAGQLLVLPATGIWSAVTGEPLSAVGISADWRVALLIVVYVIAVGPFCECVLYYGLLWGALEKRHIRPVWILVITAVVYSLAHFEVRRLLLLVVIAIPIGLARVLTGRLVPSIVVLQINNSLIGIATLLASNGEL